jgi:hypothetical protein
MGQVYDANRTQSIPGEWKNRPQAGFFTGLLGFFH